MAQPTLSSRPAYISGATNPMLYKFVSTNYSNAGYRMEVEIWVNGTQYDGNYYADSSGNVTVDVSSFVKSVLSPENTSDLTSGVIFIDSSMFQYYIKYQEVWTASSESQVDDSSNFLGFGVYGGFQIGFANDYTDYHDQPSYKFLTDLTEGQAIYNYPFTITAFVPIYAYFRVKRYTGTTLLDTTDTQRTTGYYFSRLMHHEVGAADSALLSIVFKNDNSGSANFQNTQTGTGSNTQNSTLEWFLAAGEIPTETYSYTVNIQATYASGDFAIASLVYRHADGTSTNVFTATQSSLGTTSLSATTLPTPSKDVVRLELSTQLINSGSANTKTATVTIGSLSDSEITLSEEFTLNIAEECDNIVNLQWKNSLGGDECYPFQINQEYTWYYGDRKAKRLTLFADNLSLSEWETIQGLNTLGELYRVPLIENSTSVNRTMSTIGQAVYVIDSSGNKTGVNVIGSSNTTNTKQKTHSAIVTIEYPELLLQ